MIVQAPQILKVSSGSGDLVGRWIVALYSGKLELYGVNSGAEPTIPSLCYPDRVTISLLAGPFASRSDAETWIKENTK